MYTNLNVTVQIALCRGGNLNCYNGSVETVINQSIYSDDDDEGDMYQEFILSKWGGMVNIESFTPTGGKNLRQDYLKNLSFEYDCSDFKKNTVLPSKVHLKFKLALNTAEVVIHQQR